MSKCGSFRLHTPHGERRVPRGRTTHTQGDEEWAYEPQLNVALAEHARRSGGLSQLALGGLHSAAVLGSGQLFTWGHGGFGALGQGGCGALLHSPCRPYCLVLFTALGLRRGGFQWDGPTGSRSEA